MNDTCSLPKGEIEGATTGSAVESAKPKAVARAPKALMGPLKELDPKHRLLIQYTVHGCDKKRLLDYHYRDISTIDEPGKKRQLLVGEPLTIEEAARVLNMRVKHARHLFTQAIFLKAYNAEIEAIRDGAKLAAIKRIVQLVDEPGEGKAADRTVQLKAAQALLGDTVGSDAGARVNVTVNNQTTLSAGVVVRLPPGIAPTPLEIEGTVNDD
jgi:hypothetical protein